VTAVARARRQRRRVAAALVALVLVAGACSDGGDDDAPAASVDSAPTGPGLRVPDDIAAGCGAQAVTDPADLAADRALARCGPEAPEARPLATPATVRVGVPERLTAELAPLFVARDRGEFEAEGLSVEVVQLGDREAIDALAAGDVDLVAGNIDGPFLDALDDGSGARWVLGGVVAPAANDTTVGQTGLWVRNAALGADGLSDLDLQPVAVPDGARSSATYPIGLVLSQTDITLNEVAVTEDGGLNAAGRLLDGDLAAAWLDGGTWYEVAGHDGFFLAGTLPASETIDGTVASERLLGADRAVGEAYARAIIRTINTYLTGDYRGDDDTMAVMAEVSGIAADDLATLPPLLFDWEVRDGTLSRIQSTLLDLGGVTYDGASEVEQYVDRSLAADAVGADGSAG
jgi:NitT/TauT family transport system substrate-binding protein